MVKESLSKTEMIKEIQDITNNIIASIDSIETELRLFRELFVTDGDWYKIEKRVADAIFEK